LPNKAMKLTEISFGEDWQVWVAVKAVTTDSPVHQLV
jgi:hypothetical protein